MAKLIAFLSTFFLFVLVVGIVVWARVYAPGATWLRPADPPAVVLQVHELKDLVTVRYVIDKVVSLKQPRQPLGEESILLLVRGNALAGVDLGSLTQYDVQASGKRIKIRIPHATIFDVYADEKHTQVWDRRITWWTPWVTPDPGFEHQARLAAIDGIRQAALDMGILKQAEANAKAAIEHLVAAMGAVAEVWSAS